MIYYSSTVTIFKIRQTHSSRKKEKTQFNVTKSKASTNETVSIMNFVRYFTTEWRRKTDSFSKLKLKNHYKFIEKKEKIKKKITLKTLEIESITSIKDWTKSNN
jgi:hypothetical protein